MFCSASDPRPGGAPPARAPAGSSTVKRYVKLPPRGIGQLDTYAAPSIHCAPRREKPCQWIVTPPAESSMGKFSAISFTTSTSKSAPCSTSIAVSEAGRPLTRIIRLQFSFR